MASPRQAIVTSLAAVLVVVACGNAPTPYRSSASPTTSSVASSTRATTPTSVAPAAGVPPPVQVLCPSPVASGQRLALVNLPGTGAVAVVRDVTDIAHPVTRCTIYGGTYFRFKDATHVSYIVFQDLNLVSVGALYVVDLQTRTSSLVWSFTDGAYGVWVYSWSPDGQSLTYLSSDSSGMKWHLRSASGDRVLSDLGQVPARGVNLDNDDVMVGFSADGQYVAVEETFTRSSSPPFQVIQVSDGKLVYSRTDGTMAAWLGGGAKLYFRTSTGLLNWSPESGVQTNATQVQWVHPWASADGTRIVFTAVDSTGNHRAGALNASTSSIAPLVPAARVGAAFLTPTLVWAAEEKECSANPCGMGGPPLSGNTYIYDFGTQSEARSILTAFFDSWPHVAGQT